jgi:N-acetylmuramoyl-L-alanine amidase
MIKLLDKFVPVTCLFLSCSFVLLAFHFNDAIAENINIKSVPDKNFENEINRDFLKARYEAHKNNATSTLNDLANNNLRHRKVRILIVPGHDYEYSGAIYQNFTEAELNLQIGERLKQMLEQDSNLEVFITRHSDFIKNDTENNQDKNGYSDYFQKYLDENIFSILFYRYFYQKQNQQERENGQFEPLEIVKHNPAPGEMLYRLYAINKWVEDNEIDIVVHLHLNDYPQRKKNEKKYQGFAIYVPDNNLKNGLASQDFAKYLADELEKDFQYSNNPIEEDKIILGNQLIAVGANNTLRAISVLIEYGYIYEDQFINPNINAETFDKASKQTYLGIMNYLEN